MSKRVVEEAIAYGVGNCFQDGEDRSWELSIRVGESQFDGTVDDLSLGSTLRIFVVNDDTGEREPVYFDYEHISAAKVNWL